MLRDHFKHSRQVPCINFASFIKNNFSSNDNIHIKLDIEGSEYPVLKEMIRQGVLHWVKFLAIEWHHHCSKNEDEMKMIEEDLVAAIRNCDGLHYETWI
jgi:hypothetical protein